MAFFHDITGITLANSKIVRRSCRSRLSFPARIADRLRERVRGSRRAQFRRSG